MAEYNIWDDDAQIMAAVGASTDAINALSANIANYKNTNAVNKANKEINAEQIALQRELYERSQQYNSPIEQRKMLELAGYAPSSFLDSVKAQSVSGNAPNVLGAVPPPAWQSPNSLHAVDLSLQAKMLEKQLQEKDVDIAQKELDLGIDRDSVVDELNRRYGESRAAIINAQRLAVIRDIDDLQLTIDKEYKRKMTDEEYKRLVESVNYLVEQANTERAKQDVEYALSALYRGRNYRESKLLRPTIEKLHAEINELGERAAYEHEESRKSGAQAIAFEHFYYNIMESQMNQGFRAEEVAKNMASKLDAERRKLDKDVDWYEVQVLSNVISDFSQMESDFAHINNLKVTQRQKDDMIRQRAHEFDRRMSNEERDVITKYYNDRGEYTGGNVRYTTPRKY